jgi:hypothetical protein
MKSLRFMLSTVLLLISTIAFAQSAAPKSEVAKTEAQKSFDTMKTLAGEWEGPVTTDLPEAMKAKMGVNSNPLHVSLRVTSRGNALVEEEQEAGTPLDYTKYDHPVTMLYLDGDRLLLTHYCDAGNRPRMVARKSSDGKTVEFDFIDVAGSTDYGHMHHAVFTIIDASHHTEDWTYIMPGDKPLRAHFDLQRTK